MSNERFPHPNGHHRNDDPQPERWADASASDADALDALLNGIAQGNGSPNTRSGRGHQRPDVRTERRGDTGEAATLHAATRDFHRRFDAAETRDTGATALDPHLWETIMTATTPPSTVKAAPGTLWRDATSPSPTATTRRGRPQSAASPPPGRWAPVANATLALVILLAGFGIWRVYDGMNGAAPVDPEGTVPGLAMQPATPEPTERPAISAAAIATPDPISACDFTTSIPIFPDVDASPINGTALLLTTTGELVLTCPAEPESIVLASGIEQASPLNWPGIVSLIGEAEAETQPISVINIITGKIVKVGLPPDAMRYGWTQPKGSPWLMAPDVDNPSSWAVTDLRTMESRPFSTYTDTALVAGATVNPVISGSPESFVIAPWAVKVDADESETSSNLGGPGSALVIENQLNRFRWIELPKNLSLITEMQVSPDGQHLALATTANADLPDRDLTYVVIRLSDGHEVSRSETLKDPMSTMRWVQDGNSLAYTDNTSLRVLSTDPAQPPTTMLEDTTDGIGNLQTTYDPDVVIVHRIANDELATEIPLGIKQRIHSVNTATGNVIVINGFDASHNTSPWEQDTGFLVMYEPQIDQPEVTTYQVIDAVTGQVIDELVDVPQATFPPDQGGLGRRSVVSTDDGGSEVIAFGTQHIYLMRLENGGPVVRRIPPPSKFGTESNGSVDLFVSPDGSMLSLTIEGDESRTRWLLPLDGEPDAWTEVPSTVPSEGPAYIFFVPGTGG